MGQDECLYGTACVKVLEPDLQQIWYKQQRKNPKSICALQDIQGELKISDQRFMEKIKWRDKAVICDCYSFNAVWVGMLFWRLNMVHCFDMHGLLLIYCGNCGWLFMAKMQNGETNG